MDSRSQKCWNRIRIRIHVHMNEFVYSRVFFIDREGREIMYLIASVHLSVRPSISVRSHGWTVWPLRVIRCLSVCWALADYRADVVDRLLINIIVSGIYTWLRSLHSSGNVCISEQFSMYITYSYCIRLYIFNESSGKTRRQQPFVI